MLHSYVLRYPMTPYAGVFIATVGACVIAGSVLPNYRDSLVWVGFALGNGGLKLLLGIAMIATSPLLLGWSRQ